MLWGGCVSLFGKKEKEEIARLEEEIEQLKKEKEELAAKIPDEVHTLEDVKKELSETQASLEIWNDKHYEVQEETLKAEQELSSLEHQIFDKREELEIQSFGLYTPRYSFMRADEYRARLLEIRDRQKAMVKGKTAISAASTWTVSGSEAKGKKMIADMQKIILRAFNAECDDVIEHVTYSNIERSEKRITSSKEAISKLGIIMDLSITPAYYKLKLEELYLAFEYAQKKQEEKESQREARAEMREAAKLAREIEEERKKLEKEQSHYKNALKTITAQLAAASAEDKTAIEEKKAQLEAQLKKIDKEFADVDYREANQKAGYVYVISNIGAFGENVYKIGMTRRLDPQDRVDELGDASVPFNFDVHAMIFSNDAPKLEAALHNAFADRKLNFVNQRREFFRVSLDEIKKVVKENYDKSVEFVEFAPAEQYRESLLLQKQDQESKSDKD